MTVFQKSIKIFEVHVPLNSIRGPSPSMDAKKSDVEIELVLGLNETCVVPVAYLP